MATPFRTHLIFNMYRSSTKVNHCLDRSGDIEGTAPPGVNVYQERKARRICYAAHISQHIVKRCDSRNPAIQKSQASATPLPERYRSLEAGVFS